MASGTSTSNTTFSRPDEVREVERTSLEMPKKRAHHDSGEMLLGQEVRRKDDYTEEEEEEEEGEDYNEGEDKDDYVEDDLEVREDEHLEEQEDDSYGADSAEMGGDSSSSSSSGSGLRDLNSVSDEAVSHCHNIA